MVVAEPARARPPRPVAQLARRADHVGLSYFWAQRRGRFAQFTQNGGPNVAHQRPIMSRLPDRVVFFMLLALLKYSCTYISFPFKKSTITFYCFYLNEILHFVHYVSMQG